MTYIMSLLPDRHFVNSSKMPYQDDSISFAFSPVKHIFMCSINKYDLLENQQILA